MQRKMYEVIFLNACLVKHFINWENLLFSALVVFFSKNISWHHLDLIFDPWLMSYSNYLNIFDFPPLLSQNKITHNTRQLQMSVAWSLTELDSSFWAYWLCDKLYFQSMSELSTIFAGLLDWQLSKMGFESVEFFKWIDSYHLFSVV